MSKITVKVSNRFRPNEHVPQAKIIFEKPAGTPQVGPPFFVTKTTNAAGKAEFDPKDVPDGKYVLQILPKDNWNGPVGPDVVSGHPPTRVFRVLPINVEVRAGVILSAKVASGWELNGTVSLISGKELRTTVQPVWMQSPAHQNRSSSIDMIVVHHTDCNRDKALDTFMSEKGPHYMIDKDGQILKLVQESQAAWHAGAANWDGHDNVNSHSIGIEIVNTKPESYTEAQYTSLLVLLDRLLKANSGIDPWNIVGHSDVGVNHDGALGRKSTDPGWKFEWNRLEQKRFGLLQGAGPWPLDIYGGFFSVFGTGKLQEKDNDAAHRWGGKHVTDPGVNGKPVRELQDDLKSIGYAVGTPDGGYGHKTARAISVLQEHFFAGGRGTPAKLGEVDIVTAQLIKSLVSIHST